MLKTIKSRMYSVLSPLFKNQVYIVRSGLAAGLKRRGDFGFLPFKTWSQEDLFLRSLDFKGKTVYDVGGHVGLKTMFFAREVQETGNVVTFEPNPKSYAAILDHINLNGLSNVRVIQMGLGSKRETLKFLVPGSSGLGSASLEKQKQYLMQKDIQVFYIEVDTMDNQIATNILPKPDFVKIDVEGLEIEVLHGMIQTISKYRPAIFVELHGVREREVVEFLLDHCYKIHQVEDQIDIDRQKIERIRGHLYTTPQISDCKTA